MTVRRGVVAAQRRHATNASGIPIPAAPTGWTRVLAEDFDTPFSAGGVNGTTGAFPSPYTSEAVAYADGTHDTAWGASGGASNSVYKPSTNLSCTGSKLVALCNKVGTEVRSATYVATPGGNYGQTSGRFSVCFRVPAVVHGFKIAFLLWPNSGTWPTDSEIDWPEGSLYTGGVFGANMLHQGSTTSTNTDFDHHRYGVTPAPDGSWHVATIEWLSGTFVRALWDGVEVGTMLEHVPNTAMHWVIQTESDVDQYGTGGYVQTGDTGTVEVDWITGDDANSPATPGTGSAPSSTAVVTEPFTGTSGNWSTGTWASATTTSGASATLATNQGLQTTGALGSYSDTVYRRLTTNLPADYIISATMLVTTATECYPWIAFGDVASGTGFGGWQLYFYVVSGAGSALQLVSPAQSSAWFSQQTAWTTSTSLKVEILVVSGIASIRYWASAGSRPTDPQVRTNVSAYAGPTCGLGLLGGSAAASRSVKWDNFSVASVP